MKRAARNWSRWKADARDSAIARPVRTGRAANHKVVDGRIRAVDGLSCLPARASPREEAGFIWTPRPPLVKTVVVACAPAKAFHVFTAQIARWYPLDRFSVKPAVDCRFEPYVGGRLYGIDATGEEALWGHVLEWNPPGALALAWRARVRGDEAQHIDVTFRAVSGGRGSPGARRLGKTQGRAAR
jgi:hypothetical protein